MRYADMIGINSSVATKSIADTRTINQSLSFDWQLGKQTLKLKGAVTSRHTESTREDFEVIDANHYNYGVQGNFVLPGGFGINTDFTLYTRDGYGLKQLDTTDAIWNLGMTYVPNLRGKHWVFMVNAFDLLQQLSNTHYAISASGRTVSYTNALPRYVMFSVQYRLNIQPKKR